MDQPRHGAKVNRRRFLETAAGTAAGAALTAWSLKHPAPARAAVRSDRARAAEPNPKRGGVLKWAGPAEVVRQWREQLGSELARVGELVNDSLAGT